MRNLFEILFKASIIVLAALCLLSFYFVFADEGLDSSAVSEPVLHSWLAEMETEDNENLTATMLREHCESEIGTYQDGLCAGYMLGFVEGYAVSDAFNLCIYDGEFSSSQMEQAFQNFMRENPQLWNKSRSPILGAALQKSFPCTSF